MRWARWMDYLATAGVWLILASILLAWSEKTADGFETIFWQSVPIGLLLALLTVSLMFLSLSSKTSSVLLRSVVQILLLCLLLLPVAWVAHARVERARYQESFANAEVIIAELKGYRERLGSYPESLAAMETRSGLPLPRPAPGWHFDYRTYEDSFSLVVSGGFHWRDYNSALDRWGFF